MLCVFYKWLGINDPAVQQLLQDNLTSAYRSQVVEREEGDYPEIIMWQWYSVDQDKKQPKK